ncbi:hypothetical protein ABT237_39635 [Streptomyces sp. NPDC001581]|uniref:hypothetical protein n=1 Tax=Streptomyces sp. NPDC001581 TaxID=3154386 RepID=UPI0033191884
MTFFAYGAIGLDDLGHVALLENLAALGANTAASTAAAPMRCETVEQVQERIEDAGGRRMAWRRRVWRCLSGPGGGRRRG